MSNNSMSLEQKDDLHSITTERMRGDNSFLFVEGILGHYDHY